MTMDTGTAYGRPQPTYRKELAEVGAGTPMGELLRRYWHPVGIASDAGATPRQVRVLGEDLILFRDGQGRAGLVYPHCAHRGTSLYYGKVEERGIRCCYHGWLFDVQGHCLEQPCEPELGRAQGTGVSARTRPEDEYVELGRHSGPSTPDRWSTHPCTSAGRVHTGLPRRGRAPTVGRAH